MSEINTPLKRVIQIRIFLKLSYAFFLAKRFFILRLKRRKTCINLLRKRSSLFTATMFSPFRRITRKVSASEILLNCSFLDKKCSKDQATPETYRNSHESSNSTNFKQLHPSDIIHDRISLVVTINENEFKL